jgi:hypothetical protein
MTMIKIGERYINMDAVTEITMADDGRNAKVEYADRAEWIYGHEAQALLNWLNCISADVVKMFEMDIAQAEMSMSNDAEDRHNLHGGKA